MRKDRITIVYTSDLHGQIFPLNYATKSKEPKGMQWISNYIKNITNEVLIFDNGDSLQGSPLMEDWTNGNQTLPSAMNYMMNDIGYSYINIGNHDFNFGQDIMKKYYEYMKAQILCANIEGLPYKPYVIHTTEKGIRLGIIGVVTQYIPHWEKPQNLVGLVIHDAYSTLEEIIPVVRKQCDCVIVLYHGGYEKDLVSGEPVGRQTNENEGYRIAQNLDIDVLLTGHQHLSIEPTIVNNTLTLQPLDSGRQCGQLDLEFVFDNNKWGLVSKTAKIVNATIEPIDTINPAIKNIEERVNENLDQPIGTCDSDKMLISDQFEARLEQNPVFDFMANTLLEMSGADIACTSLNNAAPGFGKTITQRDIYANFIYPNSYYIVEITGEKLKLALEKSAGYFDKIDGKYLPGKAFVQPKVEHYNYDVYAGLDYVIDINQPLGKRIAKLNYKGLPVKENDKLLLCLNNYRAIGGGDYHMFENCPVIKEIDISAQDIFSNYIKNHKSIKTPKNNYKIIK